MHELGNAPSADDVATLLEQLRATHDTYTDLAATYGEEAMHRQPAAGEWSGVQVIAHIADLDLFNRTERYNAILMEDNPALPSYDPDARMAEGNYEALSVTDALQLMKIERDAILVLFEGLRPHEWARTGIHPERGEQTLFQLASGLPGHDQMHTEQLRAAAGG